MRNIVIAIVCLVVGLILSATILPDVVTETATEEYAEPFVVGSGVTNTTETLSYPSYYEDLTGLDADSDNEADTPTVLAYDEDSYDVTVVGLDSGESRVLTISYLREAHQEFMGFGAFIRFLPFLCVIGLVVAFLWAIFSGVRNRG
jgi:hypothetical protein